jgi:hypothetical protein
MKLRIAAGAAAALLVAHAQAEVPSAWKVIDGQRDPLTEQTARYAVTMPKSSPVQNGKPVTTALIIRCEKVFQNAPARPELVILFTPLTGWWHVKTIETLYRFDEGPVRDYKLDFPGRAGVRVIALPKFTDQDPIADLIAAKRLRVEITLPYSGRTFLDFNVSGANEAVQAVSCH